MVAHVTTVPRACQITTTFALLNTVPNDEYKGFLARKMLEWNEACPKEDAAAAPDAPRSVAASGASLEALPPRGDRPSLD